MGGVRFLNYGFKILSFKNFVFVVLFGLVLSSCSTEDPKKNTEKVKKPAIAYIKAPDFNSDSAYLYVQKQVDFGYRIPNTAEHINCGDWMVSELTKYGAIVTEQVFKKKAYDLNVLNLRNIIGSFNLDAKKRVLLAAHWDTRHITY